jgi:steroid 5-alpha reductase family enzyme
MLSLFMIAWGAMAVIMFFFYLLQVKTKNATVVDIIWAAGVGCLAVFFAIAGPGNLHRRILFSLLAGLWSFRLAIYLFIRSYGHPEDGRYQMLRSKWAHEVNRKFFIFYQLQAFGTALFSIPFLPVVFSNQPLGQWHDFIAVTMFLLSVAGEALADWQLENFRSNLNNKGKTCKVGLWRYSRHPNYFFEWLHWFTYLFLAVGSKVWFLALLGPMVMLLFLYKLTGIPYAEQRALASRGDDYRKYQKTTSPFIPWPYKKEES